MYDRTKTSRGGTSTTLSHVNNYILEASPFFDQSIGKSVSQVCFVFDGTNKLDYSSVVEHSN